MKRRYLNEPEDPHFYVLTYPIGIANVELQQEPRYDRPTVFGQSPAFNRPGRAGDTQTDLASF